MAKNDPKWLGLPPSYERVWVGYDPLHWRRVGMSVTDWRGGWERIEAIARGERRPDLNVASHRWVVLPGNTVREIERGLDNHRPVGAPLASGEVQDDRT